MIDVILYSFIGYVALVIWLKTDAFYEYLKFTKIKIFEDYFKAKNAGLNNNFSRFLALNYNNFFTRLVSCRYCICFWISIAISFITNFKYFGLIYFIILISFNLTEKTTNEK